MSTLHAYETSLAASGQLKLQATARLALGEPEAVFEACVLFHEAARTEARALATLAGAPPATLFGSAIEQCGLLLDGFDPPRASTMWGRLLREQEGVPETTADMMLTRLRPRYHRTWKDFANAVAASPHLAKLRAARTPEVLSLSESAKALRDVTRLLEQFPGTPSFWWLKYRLAEKQNDKQVAWGSLSRARQLDPENRRFEAMSLLVATWALDSVSADTHLASVRSSLDRAGGEICLMYTLAEIQLARKVAKKDRTPRWRRALDAAQAGLSQAGSPGQRKNLKAVELLAIELLAGRPPTADILFRAGLGEVAVMSGPSADVVDLLTDQARRSAPYDMAA